MGVGGVIAGYLSDRFGTRVVVLAGGVLLGLGLVLSGRATEVWQFYLSFGVLVGGGVSCFYVPLTVTAIKWFEDQRGMAAAIVSAGNGFGILVLSPLSRWLISAFDWRTAFWVLGDLAWLVVIPAALLLRPTPSDQEATRVRPARAPRNASATPSARPSPPPGRPPRARGRSGPSRSRTSAAARLTRARSSTWCPTPSIRAWPAWPPPGSSAPRGSPRSSAAWSPASWPTAGAPSAP